MDKPWPDPDPADLQVRWWYTPLAAWNENNGPPGHEHEPGYWQVRDQRPWAQDDPWWPAMPTQDRALEVWYQWRTWWEVQ